MTKSGDFRHESGRDSRKENIADERWREKSQQPGIEEGARPRHCGHDYGFEEAKRSGDYGQGADEESIAEQGSLMRREAQAAHA